MPTQPREARGRGDFYSDTAVAGLCLVMVTARAPRLPPCAAMEAPGPKATEAEPERGHGGVSERPAPGLRARRAGSTPAAVLGGRETRLRWPGRLGGPAAPRRARRARLASHPFVGRRDWRGCPGETQGGQEAQGAPLRRRPGDPGALGGLICALGLAVERPRWDHFLPSPGLGGGSGGACAVPHLALCVSRAQGHS